MLLGQAVDSVSVSSDDRARWILDRLEGHAVTDDVPFTGEAPQALTTRIADGPPPVVPPVDPPPVEPPPPPPPGDVRPAPPAIAVPGRPTFAG